MDTENAQKRINDLTKYVMGSMQTSAEENRLAYEAAERLTLGALQDIRDRKDVNIPSYVERIGLTLLLSATILRAKEVELNFPEETEEFRAAGVLMARDVLTRALNGTNFGASLRQMTSEKFATAVLGYDKAQDDLSSAYIAKLLQSSETSRSTTPA